MKGRKDLADAAGARAKDIADAAVGAARRAVTETRYAGSMLRAAGPGVVATPPHRYFGALTALMAQGPAAAGLAGANVAHADRVAISDDAGEITFAELELASNALANHLYDGGIDAEEGIGILCRNHRGFFVALFAAAKLGAPTVLLNTDFAAPQLADVCAREGVGVLVADSEFLDRAGATDPAPVTLSAWPWRAADGGERAGLAAVVEQASTAPPPRPGTRQRLVLLTSGTSGAGGSPQGTGRDLGLSLAAPGSYLSKIPLRSARTVVLAAPAFHAWGMASSMMALSLGNTLVMHTRFDPEQCLADLRGHRADALITVPVLLDRLLGLGPEELGAEPLPSLRIIGVSGSALPAALAVRAIDQFGEVLYNLYGSTEVAYAAVATPADLRVDPSTVGRPPLGTVIRIYDDNGTELPAGERGRIFVGNLVAFEGYTGGGSRDVIDGLLDTGDIGHLDTGGRLYVDGRSDDMIVSGGENVFPDEVAAVLAGHTAIAEAAVVGVPDERFGQRLRAYVVPANGTPLSADDVRGYVRDRLARFKAPRDVVFVDALPRNAAGKVVPRDLPPAAAAAPSGDA